MDQGTSDDDCNYSEFHAVESESQAELHKSKRPIESSKCNESQVKSKKLKKDIDVRASKGRKIRYLKIPKAVDFMSPEIVNHFSEVQRANIIAQMKTTCN